MFNFLKRRSFQHAAIKKVGEMLTEALGAKAGEECLGAFATIMQQQMSSGAFTEEHVELYRRKGMTPEEAGLAMLDGCVTAIKRVIREEAPDADVDKLVAGMVTSIDCVMQKRPGRILPRNGAFAVAAESAGLDKYFETSRNG